MTSSPRWWTRSWAASSGLVSANFHDRDLQSRGTEKASRSWESSSSRARVSQGALVSAGAQGLGLDLDQPGGVEQAGHDHRGGGGPDRGEDLAVRAGDIGPVFGAGEVHAGADHVLQAGARLSQRLA